jgi:hypothetical protein
MFNKDRVNLRRKSSRIYIASVIFLFFGLAFFLTSGFFMEESIEVLASPVGEDIRISATSDIEIVQWIYDEERNQMEVIIDTKNLRFQHENLSFIATQRSDFSQIEVNVMFEYEQYMIMKIENMDKEYIQISLEISHYDEEDELGNPVKTRLKNLYTDYREVKEGKVQDRENNKYISYITDLSIERIEGNISQLERNIEEKEEETEQVNGKINKLLEERVYQTSEEKLRTDNNINAQEVRINELEKEIKMNEERIKMEIERMTNLKQKERDLSINSTK